MNQIVKPLGLDHDSFMKSQELIDVGLGDIEWKIFKATPLHNFKYDGEEIENYCESLLRILAQQNALEIAQLRDIEISINILPSLIFNANDSPAIKISLEGIVERDGLISSVNCFTGILLSVGRKSEIAEKEILHANGITLPLFLTNYTDEVFLDGIINFFKLAFGSSLHILELQQLHLKWILALWSFTEIEIAGDVCIIYESHNTDLSTVELHLNKKALTDVWKLTKLSNKERITDEQIFEFCAELEEVFFRKFKVYLSDFKLSTLLLPNIRITVESVTSFSMCFELFWFLRLLTHFCQEFTITSKTDGEISS